MSELSSRVVICNTEVKRRAYCNTAFFLDPTYSTAIYSRIWSLGSPTASTSLKWYFSCISNRFRRSYSMRTQTDVCGKKSNLITWRSSFVKYLQSHYTRDENSIFLLNLTNSRDSREMRNVVRTTFHWGSYLMHCIDTRSKALTELENLESERSFVAKWEPDDRFLTKRIHLPNFLACS